jgi:YrbI family 3-deoxy-D-manno-octulosonate 8-phosphate phosphatase
MGLKILQKAGIKVGVITAEDRDLNRRRSKKLNLDFEYHKVEDKLQILSELCKKYQVTPEELAYVGDDVNDIGLLKAVGFSACPADACREVKAVVHFISSLSGGRGVIRELSNLYFQ